MWNGYGKARIAGLPIMRNKHYFASDFHLGLNARLDSRQRELLIIKWLDEIKSEAASIYFVGDIWDFYFEYKKVVPKGFVRLLGKLAELRDAGIEMHFFKGNHDMWMFEYLDKELGIPIHDSELEVEIHGKRLMIGHGDGLGPGDHGYKFLKRIFRNRFAQGLFRLLHPDLGIRIAEYWSLTSRNSSSERSEHYFEQDEWLIQYCRQVLKNKSIDYFIFGHRHLPIRYHFENSTYINLGDWLEFQTYAVLDQGVLELKAFENDKVRIYGNFDQVEQNQS